MRGGAYLVAKVCVHLPGERLERTVIQAVKEVMAHLRQEQRTHLDKRYAVPYQPTSFKEWKWEVIVGIAYHICHLSRPCIERIIWV